MSNKGIDASYSPASTFETILQKYQDKNSLKVADFEEMVGATGIEPVTPSV